MYLRSLKAARSAKNFWEEIFMPKSQLGGILYIFPPGPRGGGCLYFPLKHKSAMYTFVQQRGGGSRRDPNHKSMYKCAYMYVHLSLSPPPFLCIVSGILWQVFLVLRWDQNFLIIRSGSSSLHKFLKDLLLLLNFISLLILSARDLCDLFCLCKPHNIQSQTKETKM